MVNLGNHVSGSFSLTYSGSATQTLTPQGGNASTSFGLIHLTSDSHSQARTGNEVTGGFSLSGDGQ